MVDSVDQVMNAVHALLHRQISCGLWSLFKTEKHILLERSTLPFEPFQNGGEKSNSNASYYGIARPSLPVHLYHSVSQTQFYANSSGFTTNEGPSPTVSNNYTSDQLGLPSHFHRSIDNNEKTLNKHVENSFNDAASNEGLPRFDEETVRNACNNIDRASMLSFNEGEVNRPTKRLKLEGPAASKEKTTVVDLIDSVTPKEEEPLDFLDINMPDDHAEESYDDFEEIEATEEPLIENDASNDILSDKLSDENSKTSEIHLAKISQIDSPSFRFAKHLQYRCHLCFDVFSGDQIASHYLNIHQKIIDGKTCRICGLVTTSENKHLMKKHKFQSVVRTVAQQDQTLEPNQLNVSNESVIENMTVNSNIQVVLRHKCHICFRTYVYNKFIKHMKKIHDITIEQGTCRICNHTVADSDQLSHFKQVHDFEPFIETALRITGPLPEIDTSVEKVKILRNTVLDKRLCVCHYCGLLRDNEGSLQIHIYDRHCPEKFIHFCQNCDSFYPSRKHFTQHLMEDAVSRNSSCS